VPENGEQSMGEINELQYVPKYLPKEYLQKNCDGDIINKLE